MVRCSSGRIGHTSLLKSRQEHRLMVEVVRKTLNGVAKVVPNYKRQGYEIAGFAWFQEHQGHQVWAQAIEPELVKMLKDRGSTPAIPTSDDS